MKRQIVVPVIVIALIHFVAWVVVFISVYGRVMGGGGSPTGVENVLLHVLGFPLVPAIGDGFVLVALDSVLWGFVLGIGVPRVWRALRRPKVAA
jgi:hypothetical protein